jgi:hypothetical protein
MNDQTAAGFDPTAEVEFVPPSGAPAAPPVDVPVPSITPVVMTEPVSPLEVREAAKLLVKFFCTLSREWGDRIDAMRTERAMNDEQICFSLMARPLDDGSYLIIPADHPFFQERFVPAGSNFNCIVCDSVRSRNYPGQPPICLDGDCSRKFNQMPASDRQELLSAAS